MQPGTAFQSGQLDIGAEHGLKSWDLKIIDQVTSIDLEVWMLLELHAEIQIPGGSSRHALAALAGEADALSFAYAFGDLDRIGLDLAGIASSEGNLAGRAAKGFFQSDQQIGLDILTTGRLLLEVVAGKTTPPATGGTKNLLEKITETCATKVKLFATATAREPSLAAIRLSATRRSGVSALFPVGSETVVFFSLFGVAENLVSLVDLFELFLSRLFILGCIRVELAS